MKKIIFTLLGMLMITSASAVENNYVPLVREGVVWEYVGYFQEDSFTEFNPGNILYTLEFNGTTSIDGLLYYNIYRTNYDDVGNAKEPYLVAYVREENKVVTAIKYVDFYWWMIPEVLYDFNKPMFLPNLNPLYFDEVPYPYSINNSTSIEVEVGETIRNGYYIDNANNDDSFKTIEGIGVDCTFGDLLIPYRVFETGINPLAGLSAVYENGELVYKGCMYDKAQELKTNTAITAVSIDKQVARVRYFNLAGVESAEPQQGVNIKVTTYSDGTRSSEKVIK